MPTADEYRLGGNTAFQKKDYDQALMCYTLAIEAAQKLTSVSQVTSLPTGDAPADPAAPPPAPSSTTPPAPPSTANENETPLDVHLSNRSLVYSVMGEYAEAIQDARECLRISSGSNAKGYMRLVKGCAGCHLYAEALETLEEGIEMRKDGDKERVELEKLKDSLKTRKKAYDKKVLSGAMEPFKIKSIKTDGRRPQVKEFDFYKELGTGNFSRIVAARHKTTNETFAIKVIEKKQVESLKRRHPNIHNEIQMEKRILVRLSHPLIVTLYSTFQDYNALYFLMELCSGAEMWTKICHGGKLVGCHESLSTFYLAELIEVMSYLHQNGVVHRDLKPENLMVSSDGHLKLIDFGTAKDLINTDLNGPEFVGTPEFMSPETVKSKPAHGETDLWSYGVVMWQLLLGTTPFKAPSPYLGFLKIKRGLLVHHPALSDEAWDLLSKLLIVDPEKRIGAGDKNLSDVKNHPFLANKHPSTETLHESPAVKVPSLRDLCIRATADLAVESSLDLDSSEPGSGEYNDMLRLSLRDRECVMHFLDRMEKLSEPRVLRRFHKSSLDAKMSRVRPQTRDVLDLTSERQGQFEKPIDFVQVVPNGDVEYLKNVVKTVNKKRPKFVVVTGKVTPEERKIIAKISETVSFVLADGEDFYGFFCGGVQGIVVCGDLLVDSSKDIERHASMMDFLGQELEQSRMCQHHTFVFTDVDTQLLPSTFLEKVAKSRVCAIIGPVESSSEVKAEWTKKYVMKGPKPLNPSQVDDPRDDPNLQDDEPEPMDEEKKLSGEKVEGEEEDGDSDVDSDGYNMVDDDSNVMVMSTLSAKVVSLDHEMVWTMKALGV